MPPILALFICVFFVLFLLYLDRKQYPGASLALWIPTIYMLLTFSKPLGIWFSTGGVDMEEGSLLDRTVLSALFLIGLAILMKRGSNWAEVFKQNIWLIVLIGYMLLSILWSDMSYVSFKRWMRELVAVVMALVVATEADPRRALQSLFRRTIYVLIPLSYVLIHYFPEYGRQYGRWSGALMWIGVALQKNGFALLCLFSIFFLSWTLIRRLKRREIAVTSYQTPVESALLLLSIWLIMGPNHTLTYSATSFVVLSGGVTALLALLWLRKRKAPIGTMLISVVVLFIIAYGTITPFAGKLTIIDISSAVNRSDTLTERSQIWAFLVPLAVEEFVLGHGYGGFWTDEMRGHSSSHAHNGYLDVILNLGIVGLFFFTVFLLSCCRKFQKCFLHDYDWGALAICILLMAITHNIAESSIVGLAGNLSAVLLFLAASPEPNTSYVRTNLRNVRTVAR